MTCTQAYDQISPSPDAMDLGELVGSLSYALDLTEGQPPGHCIRCCWIGMQIGQELGLPEPVLSDLYFTLLLKDLGCSSNAARICALYVTDDLTFKRDFKALDGSMNAALRFILANTGLKEGLSQRIKAVVNAVRNGKAVMQELIETRCHRGADIAAKLRFSERVQNGIRCLDEHWDGGGYPDGLRRDAVPLQSCIALLSQVVDVFHTEQGPQTALAEVQSRSGTWFAPQVVAAFETVQKQPQFWQMLPDPDLAAAVFTMQVRYDAITVDEDYLDDISEAFSDVVDAKSSFTADHSKRVTLYSDMIAAEMGMSDAHRRWFRRAAQLHDLGKLGVSNQILDKPDKLDTEEWEAVKSHPLLSENILNRVSAFRDIAFIAGAHHERLDGKGYPHGISGDELPLEVRILTVADVFDALSAARPYRAAMPTEKALGILDEGIGTAFDGDCVRALKRALDRLETSLDQLGSL